MKIHAYKSGPLILIFLLCLFFIIPQPANAGSCKCEQTPNLETTAKSTCIQNIDNTACSDYKDKTGPEETLCNKTTYFDNNLCGTMLESEAAEKPETVPFNAIEPRLSIPEISLKFSAYVTEEGGKKYINVPYLAEYIAAIYQYMVGVATILAIVMIMYGGFRWVTAAGDSGKIGEAKKTITGAVVGLAIALGSYTILNLINPGLVGFKALRLAIVSREPFGEAAIEYESDQTTVTGAPVSLGSTSEDCKRVSELVRSGEVKMAKANDKAGFTEREGVIKRTRCVWCYDGENEAPGGPCEGEGMDVVVYPQVCKLIVELYEAQQRGDFSGNFSVRCIICGHTRCSKSEGTSQCNKCKEGAVPGGDAPGQSRHWRGGGIDLPPNEELQKYIVENLMGLGIAQVIGPAGWEDYGKITCDNPDSIPSRYRTNVNIGKSRTGSVRSSYNCNNGKCNASFGGTTLCGHLNHIHVGFE